MANGARIRVMIVDDSAMVRETLKELLDSDQGLETVAVASDPVFALRKMEREKPDVVVTDIEMPRMDGLTFIKTLMAKDPLPIVVCSSVSEEGSDNALRAVEYGAIEIIQKPKVGTRQYLEESRVAICDVVKAAFLSFSARRGPTTSAFRGAGPRAPECPPSNARMPEGGRFEPDRHSAGRTHAEARAEFLAGLGGKPSGQAAQQTEPNRPRTVDPKLTADVMLPKPDLRADAVERTDAVVVIGASTGGTEALKTFLEALPEDCPGIVIVQHMPERFTAAFAKRLDGICRVTVKEAEHDDEVVRGRALIAPGNRHTLLRRSGSRYFVEVKDGPLVCRHRPSVDVLFRSAARWAGRNAIGVIMTGMGDDGARGMLELAQTGAYTIAQDEGTCVVFGMPNEAIKLGSVDRVLPLGSIAAEILAKAR